MLTEMRNVYERYINISLIYFAEAKKIGEPENK